VAKASGRPKSVMVTGAAVGYCQLICKMEELAKKKDERKKRSRRGVDNAVLCRSFGSGAKNFEPRKWCRQLQHQKHYHG
jgi:hypothetical protein